MEVDTAQPSPWGACGLSRETARAGPGLPLWEVAEHGRALVSNLAPSPPTLWPENYLNCQDLSFFTCKMGLITAANPVETAETKQVIIQVLGRPQQWASLVR